MQPMVQTRFCKVSARRKKRCIIDAIFILYDLEYKLAILNNKLYLFQLSE